MKYEQNTCITSQPVKLYIYCGIPFSGKSTLAKELAKRTGFTRIDPDEFKFAMFGKDITDLALQQKYYDAVYQEMYKQIKIALKTGQTVIHDTGNFTKYERGLVRDIADKLGVESTTVYVDTPKELARQRLIAKRESSQRFNVTDEEFEEAVSEMEIPNSAETHIVYSMDASFEDWIAKNFSR